MVRLRHRLFCLLIALWAPLMAYGQQGPTAALRIEAEGTGLQKYYFEVVLPTPYKADEALEVNLYTDGNGKKLPITPYRRDEISARPELARRFRLYLAEPAERSAAYALTVQYTDADGKAQNRAITSLASDFEIETTTTDPNCLSQLSLNIAFTTSDIPYRRERVTRIHEWLSRRSAAGFAVKTEPILSRGVLDKRVDGITVQPAEVDKARSGGGLSVCMQIDSGLPFDTFDASIMANDKPPFEFIKPLYARELSARTRVIPARAEIDTREVSARPLERNLDLGVAFTSKVLDVKKPDNQSLRERQNVGTLDVLLAPFLNNKRGRISFAELAAKTPESRYDLVTFWTPLLVDAKVSTTPITQETLSLNRVVVGTEREWRWYGRSKFDNTFRLLGRASNASDRDFKRAEVKGSIEFIPLIGALNHALIDRSDFVRMELDPAHRLREIPAKLGWEVRPLVGAEFGRTYVRGRPAEFLTTLPRVNLRRAYFGLDLLLNIKAMTLTMSDLFYIRGESETERKQNYFLGQFDVPLSGISNEHVSQSIFLSFQRGKLPPFNKVGVNAFKIGYRIRSLGWFDRYR
jgi:hypothetical protein